MAFVRYCLYCECHLLFCSTATSPGNSIPGTANASKLKNARKANANSNIPQKFANIIKKGGVDLDDNILEAEKLSLADWKGKVESGGDWDYKVQLLGLGISKSDLDDFGNWHFGVVAGAQGFGLAASMYGAGAYQVLKQGGGNSLEFAAATNLMAVTFGGAALPNSQARNLTRGGFSWGDNPGDAINIMNGWDYYDSK